MDLYREVIALKPGSPELEEIRTKVFAGDNTAARTYVYFCALEKIRSDKFIPPKRKLKVFRELVKADLIQVEVSVNG